MDVHVLADGVFEALRPHLGGTMAFFGHSLGSLVAFEVCRRMERIGAGPVGLVVSSMWAPSWPHEERAERRDSEDIEAIVAELKHLNGTNSDALENEDFLRMILPSIRADYLATASYRCAPEVEVSCPVTAFVGDRDPYMTIDAVQAWHRHTSGGFELQVFGGDHFYLSTLQTAAVRRLSEVLEANV